MPEYDKHDERRKYKRHKVKEGVFATQVAGGWQLATVVDINLKGMGIKVLSTETLEGRYDFFDLFSCDENRILKHLPAVIVYNQKNSEPDTVQDQGISRCGVKFFELSSTMQQSLDYFITHHAENSSSRE